MQPPVADEDEIFTVEPTIGGRMLYRVQVRAIRVCVCVCVCVWSEAADVIAARFGVRLQLPSRDSQARKG